MLKFQINGKIFKSGGEFLQNAVFTVDAEEWEDAEFQFNHGVHLRELPAGQSASLDFRSLKRQPLLALTIRQPWLWAILWAGKDVENRDWQTRYRGRIALHASAGLTSTDYEEFKYFRHNLKNQPRIITPAFDELKRGAILGVAELSDCVRRSGSQWFQGDYGFVLKNVRRLTRPLPCKGMLKFWEVPEEIEREINRQLNRKGAAAPPAGT
jgi:hypothetical protein